jgi:hypothetical protein
LKNQVFLAKGIFTFYRALYIYIYACDDDLRDALKNNIKIQFKE